MGPTRKRYSAQYNAQVAMAALAGDKALAELASEFRGIRQYINSWKQEIVRHAVDIFERGNKKAADAQHVIEQLHRKIGQLQVERNFLAGQPAIARPLKGTR